MGKTWTIRGQIVAISLVVVVFVVAVATTSAPMETMHGSDHHAAGSGHHRFSVDPFDLAGGSAPSRYPPGGPYRGSDATSHGPGAGEASSEAAVARGELYRTGEEAFEPTLGVTSDGTIYFHVTDWDEPHLKIPGSPDVARTSDRGKTWDILEPGVLTNPDGTYDPYLHVDENTDRVFIANLLVGGVSPCHEVAFSDDGETWSHTPICGMQDHQTVFTGPPTISDTSGYPNVVYFCSMIVPPGNTFGASAGCLKSLDGGHTFVPTGAPAYVGWNPGAEESEFGIPGFCGGITHHGTTGPDGTIYLPRIYCGDPTLAVSRDEGATWEHVRIPTDLGTTTTNWGVHEHDAGVAVDRDGNLYYTWIARNRLPYLTTSTDKGATWSEPIMVAPPGLVETSSPGAIAVGAPGKVALAYMGSENSPGEPFAETDDCKPDPRGCFERSEEETRGTNDPGNYAGVTWNGYITTVVNALGNRPLLTSASINDPSEPLVRGKCEPMRCAAVYDFIDVVIDRTGKPWAAFVDDCAIDGSDKPQLQDPCSDYLGEGILGTLVGGPRLR